MLIYILQLYHCIQLPWSPLFVHFGSHEQFLIVRMFRIGDSVVAVDNVFFFELDFI